MSKLFFILKYIFRGKSVLRSYMYYHMRDIEIRGKTLDVGGGHGEEYISFMKRSDDVRFETLDPKVGDTIDFEIDKLPVADGAFDTVIFLNVMEHIYNYQHIANETVRITNPSGQLIGYIPFLMWYHPDHRDFFRYTHEAIEIIFKEAGAKQIEIIPNYCGPFVAATQMMLRSTPKLVRPIIFTINYFLDYIYYLLKGSAQHKQYALGYLFVID